MKRCDFPRQLCLSFVTTMLGVGFFTLAPAAAAQIAAQPIARLGRFDAEHTANNGHQETRLIGMTESGTTAGESVRYLGGSASSSLLGSTAWLANAAGITVEIGFYDAAHTLSDGRQASSIEKLNPNGVAVGVSHAMLGITAWRATFESGTSAIGLTAPEYNLPGGLPYNIALDVNSAGDTVGINRRGADETAWLHLAGASSAIVVGLYGPDFTSDGEQFNTAIAINDAGYVLGTARRFADTPYATGEPIAWLRRPSGETTLIGYEPDIYDNRATLLSPSGYVAGVAYGFGTEAWLADPAGNVQLVGLRFSDPDGFSTSSGPSMLNDNGTVLGGSSTFFMRGSVAWIHSDAFGVRRIGFSQDGYGGDGQGGGPRTDFVALNENDFAVGYSRRFDTSQTAWIGDPTGASIPLGLYDAVHVGDFLNPEQPDGLHNNIPGGLTESNIVWGRALRYHGDGTAEGQTAWIYNHNTGTTTRLEISVRPSDGYAFSEVHKVLENGVALGTYTRFSPTGADLGVRAFAWIPGAGVVDLGAAAPAPLLAASGEDGTLAGLIAGYARPPVTSTTTRAVYLAQLGGDLPPPPPPGEIHYVGRLGFYDARHTHASGYRFSNVLDLTGSGYALGTSTLFVGADDVPAAAERPARTAWLGNADGITRRVGFYDALHTRDDGRQETTPLAVNNGGVTIGTSTRFDGHAYRGESAWVADRHGTVLKIGYYDATHTASDGSKISRPVALNNANQLIGYSLHPDTMAATAWLANSVGNIQSIGFTDAAHTAPDGSRVSLPVALNDMGYVVGISEYHLPGVTTAGTTTWLRQRWGALRVIGFQSGVHRAANGRHEGEVAFLSANNFVAGHATRYRAGQSTRAGQTAWLTHVDGPNRRIGFYTGIHAGANNVAHSRVLGLNDNGYASGFSTQYPFNAAREDDGQGRTTWIARPDGATVRVGLYGPDHSAGPFQQNQVRSQNDSDAAVGTAVRSISGADRGLDAWFAIASGHTRRLGLFDARHRRGDDYMRHVPQLVTNSRLVAGTSARYSGAAEVGQTAWIYNVATDEYVPIVLSARASDQFAWSVVTTLREDGSAVGLYRKFSSSGASLGDRAFMYLPGLGAFALEGALDVNVMNEGWNLLGRPLATNAAGPIVGTGILSGYGPGAPPRQFAQGVYLLQE